MERITVSPDMIVLVGRGEGDLPEIERPVILAFDFADPPTMSVTRLEAQHHDAVLRLGVAETACDRLFGEVPTAPATYHLPAELRAIAMAVRDCPLQGPAGVALRAAKCVELFCETFAALVGGALVATHADAALTERDTRRIVHARLVIDEQWRDKLTLDAIARTCGVNRGKLTRGFRAIFGVSVADAIAERRLGGARQMLLATDLPVSAVGYACGYSNNASFTRAFSRRYGVVPTRLRAGALAA